MTGGGSPDYWVGLAMLIFGVLWLLIATLWEGFKK